MSVESGESYSSPALGRCLPGEEGVTVMEVSVDVEAPRSEPVPLVRMPSIWMLGLIDLLGSVCPGAVGVISEITAVCGGRLVVLARGRR